MEKEFHITYSCDLESEGAKQGMSKIKRLMTSKGSEFISSTTDYDGFVDAIFHFHGNETQIIKNVNEVLESFNNTHTHISVSVNEHKPKVLIDVTQVVEKESYNNFIKELATKYNAQISLEQTTEEGTFSVLFTKSKDRQNFQNEYCQKSSVFMKNQQDGVNISPDWEDTNLVQTNTVSFNNKRGNRPTY